MPPELIPQSPIQWGIFGVLLMVVIAGVYALMSGKLVAYKVVEDIRKDRDDRLAQAKEAVDWWKEVANERQQVVQELLPVVRSMKDNNQAILDALQTRKELGTSGGGPT